jgi:hypothetical protein
MADQTDLLVGMLDALQIRLREIRAKAKTLEAEAAAYNKEALDLERAVAALKPIVKGR